MNIIFIHTPSDVYGASRSLIRITKRLSEDGHKIKIILADNGPLFDALKENDLDVIIHKRLGYFTRMKVKTITGLADYIFSMIVSVIYLYFLMKKFKPDFIHSNVALITSPAVAAKIAKVKHIFHIRESFGEFKSMWKYYEKFIYDFSYKIVCVSGPIAKQFAPKFSDKVIILHNGFPVSEFSNISSDRINKFKEQFGFNGEVLVGLMGRIKFGRKGQDVFVKAISLIKDKIQNVKFAIVGSSSPGNESHTIMLQELISELNLWDIITLTGDAEDIKAAFSAMDIIVLASAQPEPFGGVVVEAMALNKPVVGTNVGGTTEQIEEGSTGYLVEPNNPEDMAKAILKLLMDKGKREEMGKKGYEKYLREFEFESFYKKYLNLYEGN